MNWSYPNGSPILFGMIALTLAVGFGAMVLFTQLPPRWRRPIVATATFLAGALYVAFFLWPKAQSRGPNDIPLNAKEAVAFWLQDAVAAAGDLSNTLTAFLLGLGIYSLIRIHGKKIARQQKDWGFSVVLFVAMFLMVLFGYVNYHYVKFAEHAGQYQFATNWNFWILGNNFLFDGLLQQMDAAMFSIIAFYILSAAYRAFRIRSVEATILLAAALIMILSLMGAVEFFWNAGVDKMHLSDNVHLTEISKWIGDQFQTPGIRALEFGVGLGALAMGLRLWLSLEKGGVSA